jgi:HTH-type transcriptional regulator / antitoxin HigA
MTEVKAFKPDWVSPPGDTIQDAIDEMGISQAELARRMGVSKKHINELIKAKATLTPEIAMKLELVLGEPARFWLQREANYQQRLVRREQIQELEAQSGWLKEIPLSDMVKESWVSRFKNKGEQVLECLSYFEVASIEAWRTQTAELLPAYRASKPYGKNLGAVAAWLKQCERLCRDHFLPSFDKTGLKNACKELRGLTQLTDPSVLIPQLQEICSSAGVAVVFAPAPKGCPVSGAAWWPNKHNPIVGLSLRHKRNDHLWFTLFHEIGHLILHDRKTKRIDWSSDSNQYSDEREEAEADKFARDFLVPDSAAFRKLKASRRLSKAQVQRFADSIGIAPGIVVGRLQHEGVLPHSHMNGLVVRYKWGAQ